jgi:hypothetical protein
MKCSNVQRRLLAAERPEQVSADVKRHLAECASCRTLHRRLRQIESAIPLIAVPVSTRRAAFVAQFVQQTPAELPAADRRTLPLVQLTRRTTPVKERGHRKLAVALALAACLGFLVVGLFALNQRPLDKPFESVTRFKISKDLGVAAANTPRAKVDAVLSVTDEVRENVHKLADTKDANAKEMAALANLYRQQLLDGEFERYVRALLNDSFPRAKLTEIADRLQQTDSEFTMLVTTARAEAKQPLRDIAAAAHDARLMVNKVLNPDA